MSPTSWASRIRPHSSSRHAPALSTTLAWCGPCCGPSAAALTWCTIQTCPRCGVSLCSAIVRCPARLAGSRSWRPERRCRTVPFVPGSTLSTPMQQRSLSTPQARPAFPKGVMHCHNIIRNVVDRAFRMAITPADTILMYLPLYHMFGFSEGMLMSMVTGARQLLTETFDPNESLRLLEEKQATVLHGFDTHFKDLLESYQRQPRDTTSVRTGLLASGMSSSIPIAREARKILGRFVSGYGMSEIGAGAALSAFDSTEEQCVEASGYPAPGYEIKIIDPDTGREQPTATPGEILVRSYMVMQGYYRKPEETAAVIDSDGWMHSGDMGLIRHDGHLRFMGRYKDMLKIGGEN